MTGCFYIWQILLPKGAIGVNLIFSLRGIKKPCNAVFCRAGCYLIMPNGTQIIYLFLYAYTAYAIANIDIILLLCK